MQPPELNPAPRLGGATDGAQHHPFRVLGSLQTRPPVLWEGTATVRAKRSRRAHPSLPQLCSLPRAPPIGRALQGAAWGLRGPSPSFTKPSGEGGLELAAHRFSTDRVLSFGNSASTHTLLLPCELPSKNGCFVPRPNRLLRVNILPVYKDFLSLSPKSGATRIHPSLHPPRGGHRAAEINCHKLSGFKL